LGEEVLDVGCGQDHIVVVTSDPIEPVFAWGTNKFGSLGNSFYLITCLMTY